MSRASCGSWTDVGGKGAAGGGWAHPVDWHTLWIAIDLRV
jgi:hypothetical protein